MPRGPPPTALHCQAALVQPPGSSEPNRAGAHSQKCQGPSEALGLCPACPQLLMARPGTGAPLGPYAEEHGQGAGDETGPWMEI